MNRRGTVLVVPIVALALLMAACGNQPTPGTPGTATWDNAKWDQAKWQ